VLSELESEFDLTRAGRSLGFEQHHFAEGLYGEAEVLATAKALSISHLAEAGLLHSRAGRSVCFAGGTSEDWEPSAIGRLTVWEVTQHLIRRLDQKGEKETANLKAKIGGMAGDRPRPRLTGSTRSASARAGRKKQATTTVSWLRGHPWRRKHLN